MIKKQIRKIQSFCLSFVPYVFVLKEHYDGTIFRYRFGRLVFISKTEYDMPQARELLEDLYLAEINGSRLADTQTFGGLHIYPAIQQTMFWHLTLPLVSNIKAVEELARFSFTVKHPDSQPGRISSYLAFGQKPSLIARTIINTAARLSHRFASNDSAFFRPESLNGHRYNFLKQVKGFDQLRTSIHLRNFGDLLTLIRCIISYSVRGKGSVPFVDQIYPLSYNNPKVLRISNEGRVLKRFSRVAKNHAVEKS